jgi:hypothetical protein
MVGGGDLERAARDSKDRRLATPRGKTSGAGRAVANLILHRRNEVRVVNLLEIMPVLALAMMIVLLPLLADRP